MGTSKNFSTPKGGPWTPLKNDLTDHLAGDSDITPERLVGRAIAAAGVGLGGLRNSSGGGGAAGGGGRGAARDGDGGGARASRAVGGVVAGLAGFGASVRAEGFD